MTMQVNNASQTNKEILSTITQRGQVTIPVEVRKLLGVRPRDKVAFTIEDGHVGLVPARFTLETAFQSIPALKQPLTDEEMSELAKEEKAERTIRELQSQ